MADLRHHNFSEKLPGSNVGRIDTPADRGLQFLFTFLLALGGWMTLGYVLYQFGVLWILVLYTGWFLWDFDQPNRGGRRSRFLRSLSFHRCWSNYFPVTLTKSVDLSPDNNYILAYHPHGVFSVGAMSCFMTEATGFSDQFPGLVVHQLTTRLAYIWPGSREFFMGLGASNASKENIQFITRTKANMMVIVVGGSMEAIDARRGSTRHVLKHRKGFVRMALLTGSHLVPVYGFGENNLYDQALCNPPGSFIRRAQRRLQMITGMSPVFYYGRIGMVPHKHPINVVVGEPIPVKKNTNPTEEDISILHGQYQRALEKLFTTHKEENGYGDKVIEFI